MKELFVTSNTKRMKTPLLLILGLWVCIGGMLYAKDTRQSPTRRQPPPKNTVTIDAGMAGYTLLISSMVNNRSSDPTVFFGTSILYERQFSGYMSAAGRLSYTGMFYSESVNLHASSAGAHVRFYPGQDVFFLDGMLGYGNFIEQSAERGTIMSHYTMIGGKVGWRIDFNRSGGFVLEPSIGYYGVFGKTNNHDYSDDTWGGFLKNLDQWVQNFLVKNLFLGGLRISLGMGYRF